MITNNPDEFSQINPELRDLPDWLSRPGAFLTADEVRHIVRQELTRADTQKRMGWLILLGLLVPVGIRVGPDVARWADNQITQIGKRIGQEAVRSAETESGLPITANGREQIWDNFIQAMGRTRLGRRWFKNGHKAPFNSNDELLENLLAHYEGQDVEICLPTASSWRRAGKLRKAGTRYVVTTTNMPNDLDITFERSWVERIQCSGEGFGLSVTLTRFESTPTRPQNDQTAERFSA